MLGHARRGMAEQLGQDAVADTSKCRFRRGRVTPGVADHSFGTWSIEREWGLRHHAHRSACLIDGANHLVVHDADNSDSRVFVISGKNTVAAGSAS